VESRAGSSSNGQDTDLWARLAAFVQTDSSDAGCDATMDLLDVYAELLAGGSDPGARFPDLRAHFLACGPCAEDLEGLLAAIRRETGPGRDLH
jgi:hypothetical protein